MFLSINSLSIVYTFFLRIYLYFLSYRGLSFIQYYKRSLTRTQQITLQNLVLHLLTKWANKNHKPLLRSPLHASYVSCHTEELGYNETVYLWITIYTMQRFLNELSTLVSGKV